MRTISSDKVGVRAKSHTALAYSSTGRMNEQETVIKSLVGAPERLRTLRAYICLLKPLNRLKTTTIAETKKVVKSVSVLNTKSCHLPKMSFTPGA